MGSYYSFTSSLVRDGLIRRGARAECSFRWVTSPVKRLSTFISYRCARLLPRSFANEIRRVFLFLPPLLRAYTEIRLCSDTSHDLSILVPPRKFRPTMKMLALPRKLGLFIANLPRSFVSREIHCRRVFWRRGLSGSLTELQLDYSAGSLRNGMRNNGCWGQLSIVCLCLYPLGFEGLLTDVEN